MRISVQIGPNLRGRQVRVSGLPKGIDLPSKLIFGTKTCEVNAASHAKATNTPTLYLSQAIAHAFGLKADIALHSLERGSSWKLGPILGLYVDKLASTDRPFGEQTRMLEELTTYGNVMGVHVVVLAPGDITSKIASRYDTASSKWLTVQGTMPDLVIRRSGSFVKANAEKAKTDLRQLQYSGRLHTLPLQSSNKWTLYEVLRQAPQLQDHLPKTSLCTSVSELYQAVLSRGDVYVKPPGGAQGISIYQLQRKGSNEVIASWEKRIVPRQTERYSTVFQTATKPMRRVLTSAREFKTFWKQRGLRRVIVQDTVSLPTFQGSRYDFRWLVQSSDEPTVIARVARLGQVGGITTNIHTGGKAQAAESLIEKAVGSKKCSRYLERMDEIAVSVVKMLASRYGPFAELGIDMALTAGGNIYIFEINPTPGRRMLRTLSPGTRRLSLESLLEYAIRATGYRA